MNRVCIDIIGVRVANSVRTNTFHETAVISVVLWEVSYVVVCSVVDWARGSSAFLYIMNTAQINLVIVF